MDDEREFSIYLNVFLFTGKKYDEKMDDETGFSIYFNVYLFTHETTLIKN